MTAIVWLRRDLRVHDHPPLVAALREHETVVPVFVIEPRLLAGRFPSGNRAWFLMESLGELAEALRERGGALFVRTGRAEEELPRLAREASASAVHWASDVSPFARARDRRVGDALRAAGVQPVPGPGNFCADVNAVRTREGAPFSVFSPFWRAWLAQQRRAVHRAPAEVPAPPGLRRGELPSLAALGLEREAPHPAADPGEAAGRRALGRFLRAGADHYRERHDRLAGGTSFLSPHLHFGTVSAREAEARVGACSDAFRRQLGWRDFYAHVLLHHPGNARAEFQVRYRDLEWDGDEELLDAWREGRTGFPLLDAGMRQLRATGWMHNRARLVAGSFLTKELGVDWRAGEAHFMRHLLDGDEASNNGNWQWIASVGVDPAPFFRRMYNPARHQERFDPDGEYVRRWVPELRAVPDGRLAEPWTMSAEEQAAAGCVVGRDYPEPVVDRSLARARARDRYRGAVAG